MHATHLRIAPLGLVLLLGCLPSKGPATVPTARFDYNEALARSQNEQLLVNLVRLRYQDTPTFLEVDSILASYKVERNASLNGSVGTDAGEPTRLLGLSGGVVYAESPTVSYTPLQGEAFARRFLSPIPTPMLALLAQSGWGLDRLLRCCVHSVAGIPNTPSVGGYMPTRVFEQARFTELVGRVKDLQELGLLELSAQVDGEGALPIRYTPRTPEAMDQLKPLQALLPPSREGQYRLVAPGGPIHPGDLEVRTRSLLGVMAFLAQGVEVPQADRDAGRVRIALGPGGTPFEWGPALGGQFRIRVSAEAPEGATLRVRYRQWWFFIPDTDVESKATFSLVSQLFSLQAAAGKAAGPLLTLPVR